MRKVHHSSVLLEPPVYLFSVSFQLRILWEYRKRYDRLCGHSVPSDPFARFPNRYERPSHTYRRFLADNFLFFKGKERTRHREKNTTIDFVLKSDDAVEFYQWILIIFYTANTIVSLVP